MHVPEVLRAFEERGLPEQSLLESVPAIAPGLRLVWNYYSEGRKAGAANVMRSAGGALEGVALRVTAEGFKGLDRKEGYRRSDPALSSYNRRLRKVYLANRETVRAWVYKAMPNKTKRKRKKPLKSYVDLMVQGAKAHNLSAGHVAHLEAIETVEIERALRQTPPERALRWVERQLGGQWTVVHVAPLYGGVSHATHAIKLRDVTGRGRTVVIRRWARPDWQISDPEFTAEHEASTLRLLEEIEAPAAILLGVDATALECDVPAVLQTLIAGRKPVPQAKEFDGFARGLAAAIITVHGLDSPAARTLALPYKRYYEVGRLRLPHWATHPSIWREAIQIAALPEPPGRRCFIHRDYHHGNTLWQSGQLTAILDWDRASWGPPSIDLARMRQNLVIDYGANLADSFTRAYRELSGKPLDNLAYWDIVDILDGTPDALFDGPKGPERIRRLETHLERAIEDFRRA
jgi:aminoglycoside phosphotransferase (APT) family kinase protein